MHVVGHHAPSQQPHLGITEIVSQKPQVSLTVFLTRESHALIYTTLRDVIGHTRYHASRSSRHACILSLSAINKSRSSGCPPFKDLFARLKPVPFKDRTYCRFLRCGGTGTFACAHQLGGQQLKRRIDVRDSFPFPRMNAGAPTLQGRTVVNFCSAARADAFVCAHSQGGDGAFPGRQTADPSTTLRFGRDDKGRVSAFSGEW
jgi:hypothetical protein